MAPDDINPDNDVGVAWVHNSDGKPHCATPDLMTLY